nr:GNAT family acetyltransferase [Clostridia bacterium]
MKIVVWNILDLIDEYGEDSTREVLSAFSCKREIAGESKSLNPDIEHFIKNNAIQFARQKVSVSYIVGDEDDGAILGYFTITHKPVEMPADGLSKTTMKTMSRYAELDTQKNSYLVSGFLIAQFGKNYAVDDGSRISGKELMRLANKELCDLQHRAGGGIEYLDCEADAKLINFYEGEGFRLFGERISEKDGKRYLQYMRFF